MKIARSRTFQVIIVSGTLFGLQCGFDLWKSNWERRPERQPAWVESVGGHVSYQKALRKDWIPVVGSEDFGPNDKVTTDDQARAAIHIGSAVVEIERNSSAVLRRQRGQNSVALTSGTLIAVPKKDGPIVIEIPGQPLISFESKSSGRVALNKNPDGRYQVQLLTGEATMDFNQMSMMLAKNEVVALDAEDRKAPTYVFMNPQADGIVMGTDPKISFTWELPDKEKHKPARAQFLEFSSDVGFTRPYFSRTLVNQARLELDLSAFPQGVSEVYYRLRDSEGRVSAVQRLLLAKTPGR